MKSLSLSNTYYIYTYMCTVQETELDELRQRIECDRDPSPRGPKPNGYS